ncbi:MAG: MarR family winged helix-turn-helix transcriptional regulator [Arenibacterium sp.]
MNRDIHQLHGAVTTIMRALKIAETKLHVAHRELAFVPADIQTLRFLSTHEGCKLSDLAQHLGVVPTTASSIVDRLVERGFVQRDRPESNRRAIALTLTEDGKDAYARLESEELTTMQIMLEALPADDREQFVRSMTRIAEAVSSG